MKQLILFCWLSWLTICPIVWAEQGWQLELGQIKQQWVIVRYQTAPEQQKQAVKKLQLESQNLAQQYPQSAETKIWYAVLLATQAEIEGGWGSLTLLKQAQQQLQQAEKINPQAEQGLLYTLMGALYSRAPGWPFSFGDAQQARHYFEKSLAVNPNSIDSYFFYGELLYQQGEYTAALEKLKQGLNAPPYPDFEEAYQGRKQELLKLLEKVKQQL